MGLGVVAQRAGKHCALADGQADGRESVASRAPRGPGAARRPLPGQGRSWRFRGNQRPIGLTPRAAMHSVAWCLPHLT